MSELLAVVDIGSNAVRFFLARLTPGRDYRILREQRVQTRLANGNGLLHPTAISRTVSATRRFLRSVGGTPPPRPLAVATAAVRDARNARRLLDRLRATTGLDPDPLRCQDRLYELAAASGS